jgi:hypothetical protein
MATNANIKNNDKSANPSTLVPDNDNITNNIKINIINANPASAIYNKNNI